MFTGIVAASCEVVSTEQGEEVRSIVVDLSGYDDDLEIGASVAIDGVCMTVVSSIDGNVQFEAIPETLERTTMGLLKKGSRVNIERSLRMGDELGGHILSGHIMSTARILQRNQKGEGIDLLLEHQADTKPYILEKGYVAVDGMSLTVGEVQSEGFYLHIIPETLRITTIGAKTEGDLVNIEVDSRTQAVVDTIRSMEGEK